MLHFKSYYSRITRSQTLCTTIYTGLMSSVKEVKVHMAVQYMDFLGCLGKNEETTRPQRSLHYKHFPSYYEPLHKMGSNDFKQTVNILFISQV